MRFLASALAFLTLSLGCSGSSTSATSANPNDALVGTWVASLSDGGADMSEVIFRADGKWHFVTRIGGTTRCTSGDGYTATADKVTLRTGSTVEDTRYTYLENETALRLTGGPFLSTDFVYTRKDTRGDHNCTDL